MRLCTYKLTNFVIFFRRYKIWNKPIWICDTKSLYYALVTFKENIHINLWMLFYRSENKCLPSHSSCLVTTRWKRSSRSLIWIAFACGALTLGGGNRHTLFILRRRENQFLQKPKINNAIKVRFSEQIKRRIFDFYSPNRWEQYLWRSKALEDLPPVTDILQDFALHYFFSATKFRLRQIVSCRPLFR